MTSALEQGAMIIVKHWLSLKPWDRLLIVTSDNHLREANVLKDLASKRALSVNVMIVEKRGKQVGTFFDFDDTVFDGYKVIVGATDYSLVTTKAVKRALQRGSKFLSLPLSTNTERSLLEYDFIKMDTKKSKLMARIIISYLDRAECIRVTTANGSDLRFYKENRNAGFFNGVVKDGKGFSSASIEVYIPIEETKTEGTFVADGSLGYIGKIDEPFKITIKNGRIRHIEKTTCGKKLLEYIKDFKDERMNVSSELGIGLNSLAKCNGDCYIEDESSYGTFHIGFGRNIALGGIFEASGHFDIVSHAPNIYADNRIIMEEGKIIIPEPQIY